MNDVVTEILNDVVTELESRRNLTKMVRKLENKVKRLEKDAAKMDERYRKKLDFEYAFRRFYVRFKGRKYSTDWPLERMEEAMLNLKEVLDK